MHRLTQKLTNQKIQFNHLYSYQKICINTINLRRVLVVVYKTLDMGVVVGTQLGTRRWPAQTQDDTPRPRPPGSSLANHQVTLQQGPPARKQAGPG